MAIEAVLTEAVEALHVEGVTVSSDGKKLDLPFFEKLMLMGEEDVNRLMSLPFDRVTVMQEHVGEINTAAGVYLLENGATVHVEVRHGASVKFRQVTVYITIKAPTLIAFMDAYAMTLNNKLHGLHLQPKDTETFRQVAHDRNL